MASSPFIEDFGALLELFRLKQRSIDDLQEHKRFCQLLRDDCYKYNLKNFGGVYSSEDLYQDAFIKVRKSGKQLQIAGNILNEEEFSNWLYVLVRNVVRSKDRQLNKLRRRGFVCCDKSSEELDRPAPDLDYDGIYFLNLFLAFIEGYPEEHQRAILFWLMGFSYREIEEILNNEKGGDAYVSYGTIRNWVLAILKDFKERIKIRIAAA
jgi:RNA polymerase sigma factor (sigma-70 family)